MAGIDRKLFRLGIERRDGDGLSAGRPDRRREELVRCCFGDGGGCGFSISTGATFGLWVGVMVSGSAITTAEQGSASGKIHNL